MDPVLVLFGHPERFVRRRGRQHPVAQGFKDPAGGFAITKAALTVRITAKGDRAAIEQAARDAEAGCPVSKLMKAEITLDLTIV